MLSVASGGRISHFLTGMKLSSTSALVLLWAGREHLSGNLAKAWLDTLNLDEGRSLFAACNEICPYYAEVICNRKYGVRMFIAETLTAGKVTQVVIAGAGLDPLGIDLAETYPEVRIFEVDRDNMEAKKHVYAELHHGVVNNHPTFVTADLADAATTRKALRAQGWNPETSTVLVLEGISYYLAAESLQNLVRTLHPHRIVCEYLKPEEQIAADRVMIPQQVFDLIARQCELPEIRRYDAAALGQLLDGMCVMQRMSMSALEKARTAKSRYFPAEESGWIEVSLLGF